jgi:pimeloyl-ACP methyl ester carboxylesterase
MAAAGESDTGCYYESEDGLELFYRDYSPQASGTPVLCLPGLTRNSRDFDELAPHLSATRRVVTPDLRGRGHSAHDPDWRNYNPRTYVRDVVRLLDQLRLGGLIGMLLAAKVPERLAGLVLNDIGPEIAPEGLARISAYTGRLRPVASWEEAVAQTKEIYGQWWPGLSDEDWLKTAHRAYRENARGVPQLDMDAAIGRAMRALGPQSGDPWRLFDALRDTPVLLLRGELSDVLSTDTLCKMQQRKPDLIAVIVPNRGHVPLLDELESLAAIDRFVADL